MSACDEAMPQASGDNRSGLYRQCEAEGCEVTLHGLSKYCQQRRLCPAHLKASSLQRKDHGDQWWRFCQQCGKLQHLSAFEGGKRSCRAQLARRRAGAAAARMGDTEHRPSIKQTPGSRLYARGGGMRSAPESDFLAAMHQTSSASSQDSQPQQQQQQSASGSQDVLSVLNQSAAFLTAEQPPVAVSQGLTVDLAAVWQQVAAPVAATTGLTEPQELAQQRAVLEHRMSVLNTQMALLQEQNQLEAELATLHQQYMLRQQHLQTRLQQTQQQMQMLASSNPGLAVPSYQLLGSTPGSGSSSSPPSLMTLSSFTGSTATVPSLAAAGCSATYTAPLMSAWQGVLATNMQASTTTAAAGAGLPAQAGTTMASTLPALASGGFSFNSRPGDSAVCIQAATAASAAPAAPVAVSTAQGMLQLPMERVGGLMGTLAPVPPPATACMVQQQQQPSQMAFTPQCTVMCAGGVPAVELPAAAATADVKFVQAATAAQQPAGAEAAAAAAGAPSRTTSGSGVSPFSALAGFAPPAEEQQDPALKAGGPVRSCAQQEQRLRSKNDSLEAFASVLQFALTETEAMLTALDSSMSLPWRPEEVC